MLAQIGSSLCNKRMDRGRAHPPRVPRHSREDPARMSGSPSTPSRSSAAPCSARKICRRRTAAPSRLRGDEGRRTRCPRKARIWIIEPRPPDRRLHRNGQAGRCEEMAGRAGEDGKTLQCRRRRTQPLVPRRADAPKPQHSRRACGRISQAGTVGCDPGLDVQQSLENLSCQIVGCQRLGGLASPRQLRRSTDGSSPVHSGTRCYWYLDCNTFFARSRAMFHGRCCQRRLPVFALESRLTRADAPENHLEFRRPDWRRISLQNRPRSLRMKSTPQPVFRYGLARRRYCSGREPPGNSETRRRRDSCVIVPERFHVPPRMTPTLQNAFLNIFICQAMLL